MHPSTTAFPNSEKIESLAEEIILSTLCGAISKLKHNNLENSTSEASESFTSSFSSSTLEDEVNKLQDISTTSNTIFRNENDMIDDPLSSEVDESLELPMSKKSEENESQISVIDSSYLNEEESIAFCQKTLICEEKLKWRELICHRQLAYSNFILG
ncbi:unnamed protein product [Cercopithifilaria johnstoni]|nr:unnamed protein product [Cercopithifilaria johnstoni]